MPVIAAHIPAHGLTNAAIGLGLPPSTSNGGVIRAALAAMAGRDRSEVERLANPPKRKNSNMGNAGRITADIPEDLASEVLANSANKSATVRQALALALGWDSEAAEEYAASVRRGRPSKKENS